MIRKAGILFLLWAVMCSAGSPSGLVLDRVLASPQDMAAGPSFWRSLRRILAGETQVQIRWSRPMSAVAWGDGMAVADGGAGRIWIGDARHRTVRYAVIPSAGATPVDLALAFPYLFVSDSASGAVWRLNLEQDRWERLPAEFLRPTGLWWSEDRDLLLIVDSQAHAVFAWDGESSAPLIDKGLNFPTDVAEYDRDTLLVADSMDHEIDIRGWDGTLKGAFGVAGDAEGYFAFIRSVAVDSQHRILISDVNRSWVQLFSLEGTLLAVYHNADTMTHPSYISVADGKYLVADPYSGKILWLRIKQ